MSHVFGRMTSTGVVACVCFLAAGCAASRAACVLSRVAVEPTQGQPDDRFVGRQGRTELVFHNEKRGGSVEIFPEPPLIVRNVETKQECRIEEGGIWTRAEVFLNSESNTLMVREYSGSNDWLAFYDTSNCAKVAGIDISKAKWALRADGIAVGTNCAGDGIESCRSQKIERLDAACRPRGR